MAKKDTEKTGLEFIESPEALAGEFSKAQSFLEKNKKFLSAFSIGLVAGVLAFLVYKWYVKNQDSSAQASLSPLVYQMEADSTKGLAQKFANLADSYGSTKAGEQAHFYAGALFLKEGKFDLAIEHLKDFSANDLFVQARAYSLIGDAYSEKKSYGDAADYYKKAANHEPNKFTTPDYLMKLAAAQEANKDVTGAIETYSTIIKEYEESQAGNMAKRYKSKLEGAAVSE